jgi:GDP-4-dehydro-6-deoxy-D-mannose reductase
MAIRVLITGINGFAGCHLSKLLAEGGYDIWGTRIDSVNLDAISRFVPSDKIHVVDIRKRSSIEEIVKKTSPDVLFHLAAVSWVPASWENPALAFEVNLLGSINVFESVLKYVPSSICILISTGDFYDASKIQGNAVDENAPIVPRNPYALSKMTIDLLAKQYFLSRKFHVIRLRPFNHIGPYQSESFVVSEFSKQIALAEKGKIQPILRVGNLDAERDFTDVRDMVRAYEMAINKCEAGECYNISSQKAFRISTLLDILLSLSKVQIKVETDAAKYRPLEVMRTLGNSEKFRKATGWIPEIPIEKTVEDVLNYWRGKV